MRQRVAIVLLLLPLAACAPKTLSPEGQRAFTALQVTQRIGEFQNAVIAAADAGRLPVPQSRQIVMWTVASLETLKTAPAGWDATLRASWETTKPIVQQFEAVSPWVEIIDIILGGQ